VNVVAAVVEAGTSVATNLPSTDISSLAIPSASDTEVVIGTVPLRVEPLSGEVIETLGGVILLTLFCTVGDTTGELAALLCLSIALALNWCWPFVSEVVSTLKA